MADKIEIRYDGGMAAAGQLHFYEYSRASYGFARLLNTAEHFRRTGQVAQKIRRKNYVDLIIIAPKEGSFVTQVIVPAILDAAPKLADVPIKALIAYVFQLLSPRSKQTEETVVELARIRLAEEKERTAQSREETKRIETLKEIVETQQATTRDALDLVKYAMSTPNRAVARLEKDRADYEDMRNELEAELGREEEIKKVEDHLNVLDPRLVARLTSRVRPMVTEMGLPLRNSAETFTVGAANDNKPVAYFDKARVAAVESKEVLEEPCTITARIRSYDRDAGVGKLTSDAFNRTLNFIVAPDRRTVLQPKILQAMDQNVDTAKLEVLKVIDKSKEPTSLILLDVVELHESRSG